MTAGKVKHSPLISRMNADKKNHNKGF